MQDLRLMGVHHDGEHLLLADAEGTRFRVPVDDALRAAVHRDRPRLGQRQLGIDGGLRPRDVQSMIRAGASADEAAERAGWSVEKVRRYEAPIAAERAHIATLARAVRVRDRAGTSGGASTLEARVSQRMTDRGVNPREAEWDSWRAESGPWTVVLSFPAGGRVRAASWHFDLADRTVTAVDDEARWLSEDEQTTPGPIPAAHLTTGGGRAARVYDVEAEGGLLPGQRSDPRSGRTPGRPAPDQPEPVDLMTAMRERSAARSRRRSPSRRDTRSSPTDLPGSAQAPPEDALPLEHIGYDPRTMPPPPAAHAEPDADGADGRPEPAAAHAAPVSSVPGPVAGDGGTSEQIEELPAEPTPGQTDVEPTPGQTDVEPTPVQTVAADLEPVEAPRIVGAPANTRTASAETTKAKLLESNAPAPSPPESESESESRPRDATAQPAAEQPPTDQPEDEPAPPGRPARKKGRPSVPSWDDVMFGARPGADRR